MGMFGGIMRKGSVLHMIIWMNPVSSLLLLGSLALTLGCPPVPGAINVARYGEASQDSDHYFPNNPKASARNAIDGVKYVNYDRGSCTHTTGLNRPWWRLNLKNIYKISSVILLNRGDCCAARLLGAQIRIGNSPYNDNPVCGQVTNVQDLTLTFCCYGMEGQYVSVVIPGRNEKLTLCEVEVYGYMIGDQPIWNSFQAAG
ncbi:fucolectin-like isoform X2 [Engystomops pustulosus]|uniref:fucolectin-like isoform X2 n=1 Tax=Engystomops pustulosus TaxID=76066 RepID=UPI003AFB6DE0